MSSNKRQTHMAFALALIAALSCASASAQGTTAPGPLDFKLRTTDGGEITSEMVRGDVVVLAFGSSLLGPLSKSQAQGVQELADHYGRQNVRVYFVCTDSDSAKSKTYATDDQLRDFAHRTGLKVAVLRDPDGALFKHAGADQLPAVVLLDRHGAVSVPVVGGLDPNRKLLDVLSDRINKLLGEH
ncbi:MAG TPA: TlpA disulfide reductase family protein [Pyrinomonadaceae bacterium]|nr:TlpA disulfide reductase family protein [Pyrinomonadaceae bacterium]